MSLLTIYAENQPQHNEFYSDFSAIAHQLHEIGVVFERWPSDCEFADDADHNAILAAYADSIDRLRQKYRFQSVDVISLTANHPDKVALRKMFLAEHTHDDFEIRFFVEGCGLFYLHVANKVYGVLCERGDLISVPANTPHWFDLGSTPNLKAIRLFTTSEGWVANFTGHDFSKTYPSLDEMLELA